MIKVANIVKKYNKNKDSEFEALHEVNMEIKDGEMVALIGKSGAGKSTLLHILACIDSFDSGEYILNGQSVKELSEGKRSEIRNKEIGMIMQDFALIEEFSALDNVGVPLYFCEDKKKRKNYKKYAMAALKEIGIEELASKKINQLSGGQKQRVAIARAIVNAPGLILADEPTGALDSLTSDEVMKLLEGLNQSGKTILIVTHDNEIAQRCQRIIKIEDGRIGN